MDELKRAAAYEAVDRFVEDGMVVGLGTGTTAFWVVQRLGELLAGGERSGVRGIPTSERTAETAREVGVPLLSLAEARPDITLDGADEVGPNLGVLKGLGGALLREKIVAASSRDGLVVVADGSKSVEVLGDRCPLPVEVEPFGWEATMDALASLGCEPTLRLANDKPFMTDGGHYTVDCKFPGISEPASLEAGIRTIPGALECGLFTGLARAAVLASAEGETDVIER